MSINGLFDLWKILEIKLSLFPTVCKKLKDREKKKERKAILFKDRKPSSVSESKNLKSKYAKIKTFRNRAKKMAQIFYLALQFYSIQLCI